MCSPIVTLESIFIVIFFSTLHNPISAQEKIEIGEKITLQSTILNDYRAIYISLPKSYNDTVYSKKHYPILYFFDGDSHFENLVAQRNWLTRNLYATMPEVILVGIRQKDRTNELTPTKIETPKEWKRANFSTSGGNEQFMQFIEEEVKPMINKKYRTNGYEILSGHSFGGLASMYCFINTPHLYDAYIAIDPSMWWDQNLLLNQIKDGWITPRHKGKILFVAKANDPGSGEEHHQALLAFHNQLNTYKSTANFEWKYQFYEGEDHGSVVVPAEFDAFRFIFDGYQMPVKQAMKTPNILDSHYQFISKRLGYSVIPEEAMMDQLAKVCIKQSMFKEAADLLLRNTEIYPKSPHALKSYANFLKKYKTLLEN